MQSPLRWTVKNGNLSRADSHTKKRRISVISDVDPCRSGSTALTSETRIPIIFSSWALKIRFLLRATDPLSHHRSSDVCSAWWATSVHALLAFSNALPFFCGAVAVGESGDGRCPRHSARLQSSRGGHHGGRAALGLSRKTSKAEATSLLHQTEREMQTLEALSPRTF
jgi:hypothetical protein